MQKKTENSVLRSEVHLIRVDYSEHGHLNSFHFHKVTSRLQDALSGLKTCKTVFLKKKKNL